MSKMRNLGKASQVHQKTSSPRRINQSNHFLAKFICLHFSIYTFALKVQVHLQMHFDVKCNDINALEPEVHVYLTVVKRKELHFGLKCIVQEHLKCTMQEHLKCNMAEIKLKTEEFLVLMT